MNLFYLVRGYLCSEQDFLLQSFDAYVEIVEQTLKILIFKTVSNISWF